MTPYTKPQLYATVFDQVRGPRGGRRFQGIRWRTRFDTSPKSHGVALFGESGEQNRDCAIFEIDGELEGKLRALLIDVAPPAALAELDEAFVGTDGLPPGSAESDAG